MNVHSSLYVLFALITTAPAITSEGSLHDRHQDDTSPSEGKVVTIESTDGDIYDCYDIFKQPSISHPALRRHNVKVNPGIYRDTRSRFFAKWVAGPRGCFDTRCRDFIQTARIPLGIPFRYVSEDYKTIYESDFQIQLERGHGWWLFVYGSGKAPTPIGYWPIGIFNTLRDGAYLVRFGGEVYTSPNNPSPQMGNGKYNFKQYEATCYMRHVRTIDETGRWIDGDNSYMQNVESRCFYVGDNYNHGTYGYAFMFGGIGGRDQIECKY